MSPVPGGNLRAPDQTHLLPDRSQYYLYCCSTFRREKPRTHTSPHSPSWVDARWFAAVGQTCRNWSLFQRAKPRTRSHRPSPPCLSQFSRSSPCATQPTCCRTRRNFTLDYSQQPRWGGCFTRRRAGLPLGGASPICCASEGRSSPRRSGDRWSCAALICSGVSSLYGALGHPQPPPPPV